MYFVRVGFTNRFGAPFAWTFQCDADDYALAIDDAILTFWSGLTRCEREDCAETIEVLAHPCWLLGRVPGFVRKK